MTAPIVTSHCGPSYSAVIDQIFLDCRAETVSRIQKPVLSLCNALTNVLGYSDSKLLFDLATFEPFAEFIDR
jgi:hypothetical protein